MDILEFCSRVDFTPTRTLLSIMHSQLTGQEKHDELQSYLQQNREALVKELLNNQVCVQPETAGVEAPEQQNTPSHSPLEGDIIPDALVLLHNALSIAKSTVTKFQKLFVKAIKSDPIWVCGTMYPSFILVSLPDGCNLAPLIINGVKSTISEILFEGFENVSFNTSISASRFVDTAFRQTKFYLQYLRARNQTEASNEMDPQYEEFCQRKATLLLGEVALRGEIKRAIMVFKPSLSAASSKDNKLENMTFSSFEALGGAELSASFQSATRSVWLLHKLAFSFEPPASILRAPMGSVFILNLMHSVGYLSQETRFATPKVHCMLAPGLHLDGTIFRSEVVLK